MKKLATIVAALFLLTASTWAQDGNSLYSKYSDNEKVTAVYISSAMFELIGKIPNIDMKDSPVDIGALIKELKGMYLLGSEDPEIIESLKDDVKKYIKKNKFEMLMEIKEKGETIKIYTDGSDKTVYQIVLTATGEDGFKFICLDGEINRKDLEKAIAESASKTE